MFERSHAHTCILLSAFIASLAACSGSPETGAPGEDEAPPASPAVASAGTERGEAPYVVAVFDVALTSTGAPTAISVTVTRHGAPVRGAHVTAGTPGAGVSLTERAPGEYAGTISGAHPCYTLSVDTEDGGLYDASLVAPAPYQASLGGDHGGPKLSWAPSHESKVDDVRVTLVPNGEDASAYDVHTGDVGTMSLPAHVLRDGSSWVRLERSSSLPLAHGIAFVHMTTMTSAAAVTE